MKNILRVLLLTAGLVFAVNSSSYAIVDISAYGGYTFKGETESRDIVGLLYGAKAHYNTSIFPLLELGLGVYYEQDKLKYDNSFSTDFDAKRQSIGFDGNLILSLPVIHPYGRFTYAFWDKIESDKEKFKAWGAGGGLEITIIPFFRIFAEYMYQSTKHDSKVTMSSANLGVKFDL